MLAWVYKRQSSSTGIRQADGGKEVIVTAGPLAYQGKVRDEAGTTQAGT
jgi:hypothetical protein